MDVQKETQNPGKVAESISEYAKQQLEQSTMPMAPSSPSSPSSNDKGGVKPKDRRRVRRRKHTAGIAQICLMIDREAEFSNLNNREMALVISQELGTPVSESSIRAVRRELKKYGLYIRRLDERVEAVLKSRGIGRNNNNGHGGAPTA